MSELPPDTVDPPAQSEDSDSVSASAPTETEADPEVTIESVIEAVLFASDEPVTLTKLAAIVETTGQQRDSASGNSTNDTRRARAPFASNRSPAACRCSPCPATTSGCKN